MGFTINIAKGIKKRTSTPLPNKISRLCLGTTVINNNEYKCKISLRNDPEYPDYIIIPFTKESLDLKGKVIVFEHKKDEYGHYVEHHRNSTMCKFFPGLSSQYTTIVEGEVCSGYVIRKDGKLYFDMKAVHGRGSMLKNIPNNINETTPLFNNKTDEHNTD